MERRLLGGYRVLDLTDEKGLLAARILADLGAEVIKIEKPGGDEARRIGPFFKDEAHPERSLFWFAFCMNKKSITLDITKREGRDILRRLSQRADFLFESFPPGYMKSLDLGYEELSALNKRLIYVSISPFGQWGPYREFKAPDLVVWALSGFLFLCGNPARPPVRFSFPLAYLMASGEAAIGALLALHFRSITGEGQWVDVSAQHVCTWPTMDALAFWEILGKDQIRAGSDRWRTMPRGEIRMRLVYPCRDGHVLLYIWGGKMCEASNLALHRWMEEEGEDLSPLKGTGWPLLDPAEIEPSNYEKIVDLASHFLGKFTKKELYQQAIMRGIMLVPISTIWDVCRNEHLEQRGFWHDVHHEELRATIRYPGPWARLSETPLERWERAPLIGEHNNEIYLEELRMSPEELSYLLKLGVI